MKITGYAVVAKLASENGTISNEVFFDWSIGEVRSMAKANNLFVFKCVKKRYSYEVKISDIHSDYISKVRQNLLDD